MGASAAGPVWVKIMNEALRLYNVPKDLPDLPAPHAAPAPSGRSLWKSPMIEGETGPNILEDDPSAMPKLTDIPMEEQGAALAPSLLVAGN